jgi:hypothetical protein
VSVVTAEGDTVTFRLDVETDFRDLNYQNKAQFDDKSLEIKGEYAESFISLTRGLTVKGDLNEQEVADLTKLFKNVTSIFRKFFRGQDEQAVAKTAKLAGRFGNFSSLGGLDLSVNVTRSVTGLAAPLATQQAAKPTVPPSAPAKGTAGSPILQQDTPGAAPSAVAAIPPPSSGITAPTQPLAPASPIGTSEAVRISAPAMEDKNPESLVHQVFNAVHDAKVEAKNLRKDLPRFFEKMRVDLQQELRGENKTERKQTSDVSMPTDQAVFLADQSTRKSSITLSIHPLSNSVSRRAGVECGTP